MRIVVFGGAGFLGSHVADALTEAGHNVVIFDIRESPYILPGQTMIVGDILDNESVESAIMGCDVVYNFAGIADIDECVWRPVDTVKYNILGNIVVLDAARKAGVKRFIFASSVYVYSEAGSIYRTSKQACESFIENYRNIYSVPYTILRYGSLYGERGDERNSIYRLIKEALLYGRIIYHGTGDEVREYIHVKDAAKLSVQALEPEFENQHVILTGNLSMKYRDLLEMIGEMLGNKIEIIYKERKSAAHYKITPYSFNPKLGRKLVNNPHIDMGQGLLSCMAEIYETIHKEKYEKMGLLLENNSG
jgi:UDP-glucose 4-epimerase